MSKEMIKRKSWEKFRESGLLWFVNRSLHLFGWGKLSIGPHGEEEFMSNARLIAAAPEMLELLKELEFVLEDENGDAVLCPVCTERMTHAEDCKLKELLRKVEGI